MDLEKDEPVITIIIVTVMTVILSTIQINIIRIKQRRSTIHLTMLVIGHTPYGVQAKRYYLKPFLPVRLRNQACVSTTLAPYGHRGASYGAQ